jgi:uncharacterized repeat protein (TIGR03837 family)
MAISCDLFCRVVDNLGDAGVCWRLACQLARDEGWTIRLWIDDFEPLTGLRPGIDASLAVQMVDGVEIRLWPIEFPEIDPHDVVIEAFACDLPARFVAAMAERAKAAVWINLEYLSAEDWVAGCHGKPSPHPRLPLTKHFFFPGFVPGTGGLIRERDLPAPTPRSPGRELRVSLFCYDNPALPGLLTAWAEGGDPISCLVADGLPRVQVGRWLGRGFPVGAKVRRGSLDLHAMPFLAQPDYDRALVDCDLNFVRGEDSFVRAQWAERPFIWQPYPQAGDAHWPKLDAFLGRYACQLSNDLRATVTGFWHAWNGRGDVAVAWSAYRTGLSGLTLHGRSWAEEIAKPGELAKNLARFCRERL